MRRACAATWALGMLVGALSGCQDPAQPAVVREALATCDGDAGAPPTLDEALTTIDSFPSRREVDFANGNSSARDELIRRMGNSDTAIGIRIRIIRLLPQYCPETGCASDEVHTQLYSLVSTLSNALASGATLAPADLLQLRAGMEALGAIRSGLDSDVALFTTAPQVLLRHPVRDVQATAVESLHSLCRFKACSPAACSSAVDALRMLKAVPALSPQVDAAVIRALQDLSPCPTS